MAKEQDGANLSFARIISLALPKDPNKEPTASPTLAQIAEAVAQDSAFVANHFGIKIDPRSGSYIAGQIEGIAKRLSDQQRQPTQSQPKSKHH